MDFAWVAVSFQSMKGSGGTVVDEFIPLSSKSLQLYNSSLFRSEVV